MRAHFRPAVHREAGHEVAAGLAVAGRERRDPRAARPHWSRRPTRFPAGSTKASEMVSVKRSSGSGLRGPSSAVNMRPSGPGSEKSRISRPVAGAPATTGSETHRTLRIGMMPLASPTTWKWPMCSAGKLLFRRVGRQRLVQEAGHAVRQVPNLDRQPVHQRRRGRERRLGIEQVEVPVIGVVDGSLSAMCTPLCGPGGSLTCGPWVSRKMSNTCGALTLPATSSAVTRIRRKPSCAQGRRERLRIVQV